MGVAYFKSNKLYLMVKISWHEFDVVWVWLFSQMAVPDGGTSNMNLMWVWLLVCYFLFQASGCKV